ncbi:MAG: PKD domain-containing protein [Chitinophagales bacterium]
MVPEGGSSGSPLFNDQGQVIGTLHGGSYCTATNQSDQYGKVSYHWNSNGTANNRRLDIWLDPAGSGSATSLAGTYAPCGPSVALDAGISVIISPDGTSCGASFTPEVTLKNFGSSTLTSCVIRYRIDAGALQTYNWTGSLATNATVDVTLNAMTTTNGAHTFTAYTQNPNGGTDGNSANDSQTSNFTTTVGSALPLTQTFQTATFPPTNYTLNNGDASTTWARTTAAGSGSTASMFIDNWNYNAAGAYDWFILPTLNFSGVSTGTLSFDVAYAYYDQTNGNNFAYDTLGVAMTNDCGASWFWIWKEGGVDLATAGGLGTAFTPTAAQWENIVIDLNDPAINNQANVQFAFIGINDYGNNLYVDNINVQVAVNPTPPVANFTANATSVCAGTQVSFTNSSTNSPTSYAWSFPGGTPSTSTVANPTVTYNTPGTYTVSLTATNADGSDDEVKTNYIVVNPNPTVNLNPTNPSCFNGTNGSVTAVASGGSSFSYSWTGTSGTGATVNNLGAGSYSVVVTNNFTCTGSASTTLTQPSTLVVNVNTIAANCGGANGSATASASGGVLPYSFSWSGGSNTNLSPGNYSVTVTDGNLCTKTQSFTIGNTNTNLSVSVNTVNETCGQGNGSASASASGGTAPYTLTWSSGSNTGLSAGNFTVTATDANGCTGTASFTIANTNNNFAVVVNTTASACSGNTGTAVATVNGSAAGYTFNFSAGTSTGSNSVSGLAFGNYNVSVTDAQGCSVNQSFTIGNLNAPVISAVNVQNILCAGGANGAALAQVSGGTPPYQYNWGSGFVASSSTNSLSAGNYSVLVSDGAGCSTQSSFTITEPAPLLVVETINDDHCSQGLGSISVNVSGGTPGYSYSWNGQTGSALNANLQGGTYSLNVLDGNSCSLNTSFVVQNIAAPSISNVQVGNVNCYGDSTGSINLDASGAGTLTYDWGVASTEDLNNVQAGSYTLVVSDAFGCSSSITEVVSQPSAALDLSLTVVDNSATGGTSTIASVVNGGTQPYTFTWSNGFSAPTISNLPTGLYSLTLTDANGCIDTASASIGNVGIHDFVWLDNISLYPNPTEQNLNIEISLVRMADLELEVYNALGQIIYKRSYLAFTSGKEQISMAEHAQGVYFLRLSSADGSRVFSFTKQ